MTIVKRIISLVTSLVMTWLVVSVSVKYSIDEINAMENITYGDIDNDKIITVFDMIILREMVINRQFDISADLDGNNCVNFEDISLLNDFLLGKINSFPIQHRSKLKDVSYETIDNNSFIELSLTNEMAELTDELATPLEVYNYIYNNIDTSFYTNSRKGAIGTFDEKCGNDVDQASLLISMLKYLGYEAEYDTYLIGITDQQLLEWTGCQNVEAALKVIEYGNTEIGIYPDMEPVRYTFQHTIVKALIDDNIVYLDTSFKKYKKVKTVYDELGLYTNEEAYNELLNNELSFFETEIDSYLYEDIKEGEYYFSNTILEKNTFDTLPFDRFGYGYDLIAEIGSYNPLDEINSDTISFCFGENKKTIRSAEIYGKNISICFENVFDDSSLEYIPIVKIDENVLITGSSMKINQKQDLGITIYTNKSQYNYKETLTVGEMCSIFFNYEHISSNMMSFAYTDFVKSSENTLKSTEILYQGINEKNLDEAMSILYTSDNIGKLLRFLCIEWFSEATIFNDSLKEMSNVRNETGLSFALISYSPLIENNEILKQGIFSTNINQLYRSIERENNTQKVKSNNLIRGMFESSLEKKIFKKNLDIDIVSTLDIFQQAEIQNLEICRIDKNNKSDLDNLNLNIPSNELNIIKTQIDDGNTILIPSSFMKINDWGGIGYISIDPSEESAFYYRYGGYGYNGETSSTFVQSPNKKAIAFPLPIPLPIIAAAVIAAAIVIVSVNFLQTTIDYVEDLKDLEYFKNEAKEIERVKTKDTYNDIHFSIHYHATTMENALKIQTSLRLYPTKNVDGGLVYAWRWCPDERAIAGSGAQYANVIVKFETAAAFEPDTTIVDEHALLFAPERACIPGPISIVNPVIITKIKKNWFWRMTKLWN